MQMTDQNIVREFLHTSLSRFRSMKQLGEAAIAQIPDEDLFWLADDQANSIAIIMQHLHGNMLSRWTDFLTSDGEKDWRNRDSEFEQNAAVTREDLFNKWEEGWQCLFHAVEGLQPEDITKYITIRGEPQSVIHAIQRQLSHYSYHVGQIVLMARMRCGETWQPLSISRGQSENYKKTGEFINLPK